MAATGKVIGTVTAVVGEAKATAADGTVRILQVGDAVRSDEVITTSAAGSINVALESGKTLDCGGDVSLTLHESILGVATAAPASTPTSDVDAIQRAIAAGQDPSQVAAATAAGGAPAAGGIDDGGAHEPVILEQSNTASVVTSGFTTEGDTITIAALQVQSEPGEVVALVSAPLASSAEIVLSSIPAITIVESASQPQVSIADQPVAPVSVVELAQGAAAVIVEVALPVVQNNEAPQTVVTSPVPAAADEPVATADAPLPADTPAVVVADAGTDNGPAEEAQPPVVLTQPVSEPVNEDAPSPADTPVIVATDTPGDDEVAETPQPPVVVTQPEDEVIVVNEPEDDSVPPVVGEEPPAELPDSTPEATGLLTYSISANTNQDEQLAFLTLQNNGHTFESLVFFHQQGQQKPIAAPLDFSIDYGSESVVKLEYIDAFAGNSDSSTGHTAQKIAIKDFALGDGDTSMLLVQESDGVNIGLVGKTMQTEGTVVVEANVLNPDAPGTVGDWDFDPTVDVHERYTYDGGSIPQADDEGVDILDVTVGNLDLGSLGMNDFEVIALKGSGEQTLTLSVEDVLNVTGGEKLLHIIGGQEQVKGETVQDTLELDASWTIVGGSADVQPLYFGWVQVTHSSGTATLLVDPDVNITNALMG